MVWNWSWDIKGNCSFKLIPFRNKLHKPWSARNISVSVRMQRDRSCNWNPGYLCKDGYCVCVCVWGGAHTSMPSRKIGWIGQQGRWNYRERGWSWAIWLVPQRGEPVRGGHNWNAGKGGLSRGTDMHSANRAVGKKLLSDWHLCWSEAAPDAASCPQKLIRMDGSLLMP